MVVLASRSSTSRYKVPLPNNINNPGCQSGIPDTCDGVCCEYKFIPESDLMDLRGSVSRAVVDRLTQRVREAREDRRAGKFKTPSRD